MARLQSNAGNAAVARLLSPTVQRKGDARSCPSPPSAPEPANPRADPRFAGVTADAGKAAKELKHHPAATEEARKVQDSAEPPADDRASQAKAAQVDTMAAAKPKGFDKAAFVAAVKSAIAAAAPKNLDEADGFATSSKPDEIKASVASKVTKGKDDSGKEIAEKTGQPPNLAAAKVKPVVPLTSETPVRPVPVNGAKAMPDKAPPEQTELNAGPCEVDATMGSAGVTEEHLVKSNEATMQGAVTAKRDAEAHASSAPAAIRRDEASTLRTAQAGAGTTAKAGVEAMVGTRGRLGGKVAAQKMAAKAKDEADRTRVSGEINAIFDATKVDTEAILAGLDEQVGTLFDAGEAAAKAAFTAKHTADMERYKDLRYSGPTGWAQWTEDLFAGLPPEANQIFERAKAVYESKMTEVVSRLADFIGAELQRAKDRIQQGRQEITKCVASQPKELQKLAGETAQGVGEQFDQLESDVDDKQAQLVDDLAQKYVEARGHVDAEIKAEQEKNRGLVDKAMEAVGGAIDAIVKLKDLFVGLLAKAASAFTKVLEDPIGFIGNFMSALGQGFTNFSSNILTHLKTGVFGWLLGTLSDAGIEIPDSFDVKGIFKLIASILGLTWSSIKARIMRIAPWIGKGIDIIESKVEVFAVLATQGVAGLWEWIKDKVGDLSEMVIGPVKEFVSEKIINAGVSWLLGLLNPAGALIKIIQALVGVVQWLVERGAQLADFIGTVIDSVSEIAEGGIGGVPAKIEAALAKAVPLVISFLASLLNLGGISEKVKSVIDAVRKPVAKAVDGVIKSGLKAARPLIRTLKRGVEFGRRQYAAGKAWVADKTTKGKAWVKGKAGAVGEALGIVKRRFRIDGEPHTLSIDPTSGHLRMASVEEPLELKLQAIIARTPAAKAAGEHVLASVRAVIARVKAASTGKGAVAKKELDLLAALVIELMLKIRSGTDEKTSGRPDGLGNVAPHGRQPSSQRKNPKKALHLESEHVIPVAFVSLLLNKVGAILPIVRGKAEDRLLHTVMIYRTAAQKKTYGSEGADNSLIRNLKAIAFTGTPTNLDGNSKRAKRIRATSSPEQIATMKEHQAAKAGSLMETLRQKLPAIMNARVNTTVKAVQTDHDGANISIRGHTEPLPSEDRIRTAASLEAADILSIFIERVNRSEG